MYLTDFPSCCGAGILAGFLFWDNPDDIQSCLQEAYAEGYGSLFAILNKEQVPKWEPLLLAEGFKQVFQTPNPLHEESIITTYACDIHERSTWKEDNL